MLTLPLMPDLSVHIQIPMHFNLRRDADRTSCSRSQALPPPTRVFADWTGGPGSHALGIVRRQRRLRPPQAA